MTDLTTLPGIGKMAKSRLVQSGIGTVEALNTYIMQNNNVVLREFVHNISLNPRRDECLEGYYPRIHNKRIKDGLIRKIKELKPGFQMNDYKTFRVPPSKFDNEVIRCDTLDIGEFVPYDDSTFSLATMQREGVAYRGIPGGGYRYGKSCMLNSLWGTEKRNMELRTNPVYRNRRQYKCGCFRSEKTCNDMNPSRGNRIIKTNGRPKEPYCTWTADKCVNA